MSVYRKPGQQNKEAEKFQPSDYIIIESDSKMFIREITRIPIGVYYVAPLFSIVAILTFMKYMNNLLLVSLLIVVPLFIVVMAYIKIFSMNKLQTFHYVAIPLVWVASYPLAIMPALFLQLTFGTFEFPPM